MKEPKRRRRKTNPGGGKFRDVMTAALQAIDELGFDSVRMMREVLEAEDVLPKKENENP